MTSSVKLIIFASISIRESITLYRILFSYIYHYTWI